MLRLSVDEEARQPDGRVTSRLSRSLLASSLLIGGGYVHGASLRQNGPRP